MNSESHPRQQQLVARMGMQAERIIDCRFRIAENGQVTVTETLYMTPAMEGDQLGALREMCSPHRYHGPIAKLDGELGRIDDVREYDREGGSLASSPLNQARTRREIGRVPIVGRCPGS